MKGWTQEYLAAEVNLKTRQPIWRFLTGRPVDRQVFEEICAVLDLDWREIAAAPPAELIDTGVLRDREILLSKNVLKEAIPIDIDELVKQIRAQHREAIENQCGILQLLDISHPVSIDDIYVDVNILEEIASHKWLEITDLQEINPVEFDRVGLGAIDLTQIPGMEAVATYSKLRLLGKVGAGKTTFLQHLAILCNRGEFATHQVPVFITLRSFAEESRNNHGFSLLQYIQQAFSSEIPDLAAIETLLQAGRFLLLLDGLDEVLNQDSMAVLKEIRKFSEKYHKNQFLVTCRTAAQKLQLHGFTDVEIAPFTQEQITIFARKWFTALTKTNARSGRNTSIQFIRKLELPENWQFRQLVVTPLFLHMACWVFHSQEKFPTKRSEFYKQGLDLLLCKWDEARGVERDDLYRGFLLPQKLRLLSQLAAITFEQGQYFFKQDDIERYIGDYLQQLPGAKLGAEELQLKSEAVLKAIEAQHGFLIERAHGIFSFSYLAFQEYFTARKIVASHNLHSLESSLGRLVTHITDPHWREVFLLTVAMLRSADSLVQLMKQEIDVLVAADPYLQEFLVWASEKSRTIPSQPSAATSRAFYLALVQDPRQSSDFALASTLDQGIILDAVLDNLQLKCSLPCSPDSLQITTCRESLSKILGTVVDDDGFYKSLQQLHDELPALHQSWAKVSIWWQTKHPKWFERLQEAIAHYRDLNYCWQFSPEQQQLLQGYYDANQLLLDCLNSNCEVTAAIRQEIEATLLLPQRELEDREWQGE